MPSIPIETNKKITTTKSSGSAVNRYKEYLEGLNARSSANILDPNFNYDKAIKKSKDGIEALATKEGLQAMLVSQMISIHELQQKTMAMANGISNSEHQKYYLSSAVKLANAFAAQATLLAKLQGVAGQKIIVERVDVYDGGQAVVGNIDTK